MKFSLHIWRQKNREAAGDFETIKVNGIEPEMSFLEMLDIVNIERSELGKSAIAYDYDCREGICGTCSLVINGTAHGPKRGVTTCQTFMRDFEDGSEIWIEPFRATAFPIEKDLVVDRSAFDRIQQAGGYVSSNTGAAPDANSIPIGKNDAESAMDAAACIGCGACVAACANASASLFVAAKVSHLAKLPQGDVERGKRVRKMIATMDKEGFGSCTNHGECEAVCPKEISVQHIAEMNREYMKSFVKAS